MNSLSLSKASPTRARPTYFPPAMYKKRGGSRGKRSAAVIGGSTALGALIGGLAGGGTAVQAMKKGQQVKIPSETRLDFTLHAPVDVTYLPNSKSHSPPAAAPDPSPTAPDQSQPAPSER